MRMSTVLSAVAASLACAITAQAQSHPGTSGVCGYFQACSGNQHKFDATPDNSDKAHSGCAGPCDEGEVCHPVCNETFVGRPQLKQRYEAVLSAANTRDVAAVLNLASQVPGFVAFNRERRSVQIRGCSADLIVANLPLRSEDLLQVAMRLPTPAQMLAVALPRTSMTR